MAPRRRSRRTARHGRCDRDTGESDRRCPAERVRRLGTRCPRTAGRDLQVAQTIRGGAVASRGRHPDLEATLQPRHGPADQDAADLSRHACRSTTRHSSGWRPSPSIAMGQDASWSEELRLAGRLHDVGKVGVPDSILQKPGSLTEAEFDIMKTHTAVGARVFAGSRSTLLQLTAEVSISHHERWDGSGYPAGSAGSAIPLSGRLVAAADVYDALVTAYRYKHAWSSQDAVRHIVAGSGTQFDPRVVDALVAVIARRQGG
ncbi:MAG: HD domain-containing phosphohydrolase [Ilumatobacteraceae bacterium]